MAEDAAGTPGTKPEGTPAGGTPEPKSDDSGQVTVSAQFKKEALESWKPKAEEFNKVKREAEEKDARIKELERIAYGGGRQATDPNAELIATLSEQAAYDPVARATLMNMQMAVRSQAEAWLAGELLNVPEGKREQVAEIIRNAGYQKRAADALKLVTDPETKTLAERLAEAQAELDRLKNAKPNGASPASTVPADGNADSERPASIPRSEYLAALQRAQADNATPDQIAAARRLMEAVGTNKTKLTNE